MGFSYLRRRAHEALSRLSTAETTTRLRTTELDKRMYHQNLELYLHRRRVAGDGLHVYKGRGRVRCVKDRRPCDDPVTPRPHGVSDIFGVDSAIDFDRQRNA